MAKTMMESSSATETLISNGFQPTRTIVLAFGFDEEVSGKEVGCSLFFDHYQILIVVQGAANIGRFLLDLYGKDGFAFVIDEGGDIGPVVERYN